MLKVINIFLVEREDFETHNLSSTATGLVLELEDGTLRQQLSTDVIQPYAKIAQNKQ